MSDKIFVTLLRSKRKIALLLSVDCCIVSNINALFRNEETSASSNKLDSIFTVLNLSAVITAAKISGDV